MSEKDIRIYAYDILDCIQAIEEFTKDMEFDQFAQNRLVFDAVVKNLETIGETAKKFPAGILKNYPAIDWKEVKGLRDVIAHNYFDLDKEAIWGITREKLEELKQIVFQMYQGK